MRKNKGFTLIELIVALSIFGLIIPATMNIFLSGIEGQRKSYAIQIAQENIRYALESMSKEIRMSRIKDTSTINTLNITAYKSTGVEDVTYSLSSGKIMRNGQAITSSKMNVTSMKFYLSNVGDPSSTATIAIIMESLEGESQKRAKINLQTTVSTRDYY